MQQLILAAIVFIGIHVLSSTPLRPALVGKIGEKAFQAIFSAISLVTLVWLARAYNAAPISDVLWAFGGWAKGLSALLVLAAALLVVGGVSTPNPAAAGGEKALAAPEPAKGILRITRHPVMWGITLWGLAHLLANGDEASIVFFGGLTLLALMGPFLIDRKRQAALGETWTKYQAVTSSLPFAAIAAGRNQLKVGEIGIWRLAGGVVVYVALYVAHAWLFGVAPHS